MRILTVGNMYPPHHLGGYELTWRSAVAHLRGRGHIVRVLTTDYRNPKRDPTIPADEDVHRELRWYWHDHEFPRVGLRERLALERDNAETIDRHIEELRPDVVSWWAMGGMSLSLIERVRRRRIPSAGVVGDNWMSYGPVVDAWLRLFRGRRGVLAPLVERVTGLPVRLDLSDTPWLFNSDVMRSFALQSGWSLRQAEVAHPGIDPRLFPEAPGHEWGWRLLYVGRLDERKGIATAIEALPRLSEAATLRVLGSGDERHLAQLSRLVERLGLVDRVSFAVRPRHALRDEYAAADALVFPVLWEEPWGLVPIEAMAVGCAVVATGMGGSGEYLEHERNCLLFEVPSGPQGLAAALERLADDPDLRARLRRAGLETAARFTEQAYNERIEAALERVVSA